MTDPAIDLPPLPKPDIYVTHDSEEVFCSDVPKDQVPPHDEFFSAATLQECARAAVLAERERSARICEAVSSEYDNFDVRTDWPDPQFVIDKCAAAIRKG
jgi:hypothetical protein